MELDNLRMLTTSNILYGAYCIDEQGAVINKLTGRTMKAHPDKDGYLHLMLCTNDIIRGKEHLRRDFRVATLVAMTFIGPPEDGVLDPTIDHIDGNKTNNHPSNLRWIERSKNSSIRRNKGDGERNHEHKLTEMEVRSICALLSENRHSLREIGLMFDVSKSTISNIKRGQNWKHVSLNYELQRGSSNENSDGRCEGANR